MTIGKIIFTVVRPCDCGLDPYEQIARAITPRVTKSYPSQPPVGQDLRDRGVLWHEA